MGTNRNLGGVADLLPASSGRKRLVALAAGLLSLAVVALVCVTAFSGSSACADEGRFAGGSGTVSDPYQIATAEQLKNLADKVNNGNAAAEHYKLIENIDLKGSAYSSDNTVIGFADSFKSASTYGFKGTFDGNGYTIRNLTIDLSKARVNNNMCTVGLFGAVQDATIRNLNVQDAVIVGTVPQADANDVAVGCLIGASFGKTVVENCSVMNGAIHETTTKTANTSKLYAFGGLMGDAYTTEKTASASVWNCGVDCEIAADGAHSSQSYVGGVTGRARVNSNDQSWPALDVEYCSFTGSLKGCGYNAPVIAGIRRGSGEQAAVGKDIALAVTFGNCYYRFTAMNIDGDKPNPECNPVESDISVATAIPVDIQASANDEPAEVEEQVVGNSYLKAEEPLSDSAAYNNEGQATPDSLDQGQVVGSEAVELVDDQPSASPATEENQPTDSGFLPAADIPSEFVYDKSGSYIWGEDKQSDNYDDTTIDKSKGELEKNNALWRIAIKNNSRLLVLDMITAGISLATPSHGYYYLDAGYYGLYNGESGQKLESPVWSGNVSDEGDGPRAALSNVPQDVTLEFGPSDNRKTATCSVPAIGNVSLSITRDGDAAGTITQLSVDVVGGDAWGIDDSDFSFVWYKGDKAEGEAIGNEKSLDITRYPPDTYFTVKAILNDNVSYTLTGSNHGRVIYVNGDSGVDSKNGFSPAAAVKTISRAYELLDEHGTVESNVIVVMGTYTDSSYGMEQASGAPPNAFTKPATITGYDPLNPSLNVGTSSLEGDDARFNDYGRLVWANSDMNVGKRGKFLYADTVLQDIVLDGGNDKLGYVYCQGNNLTMERNIKMVGYSEAVVGTFGLLENTSVPNFHIVGGYLNKNDRSTSQDPGDTCTITVKSGCYARILAGCRNDTLNVGSRNTFGSDDNYFRVSIVVDIEQTSRGSYNCDVGMLCGGQTDGSLYAASSVTLNAGYVKLFLGSSIGFNRSTGDVNVPNNDYVGVIDVAINGGMVDQLYGGCLGRWRDTADQGLGIDSAFKRSDAIRRAEHLSETQADIRIAVNGGTINPGVNAAGAVFACGAGGTTGTPLNPVAVSVEVSGGEIRGSVYGGGDGKTTTGDQDKASATAGTLYGSTRVTVSGGTVQGSVYGGGAGTSAYLDNAEKRALAQVFGDTEVEMAGGTVTGDVCGGGNGIESADAPDMARVTGNTRVVVAAGTIEGSIYGGGSLGVVGRGAATGNGTLPYVVESAGSTTVVMSGGNVGGSVFGGGKGFGEGANEQALVKGAVFGSSTVKVYGGFVHDDVFGGGNESRTYAPVSAGAAQQATTVIVNSSNSRIVVLEESDDSNPGGVVAEEGEGTRLVDNLDGVDTSSEVGRSVTLGGSVFGGGNRSRLAGSQQANDYTVYGNTDVFVKGSGVDFSGENGGVYGDGNVSKAFGVRHITLIDFKNDREGGDSLKVFYSLQRADRAIMSNSKVYTLGALDRVNAVDTTLYAVNRVQELKFYDGSVLQLDTVVNGLGSVWSDVESARDFRRADWRSNELEEYRSSYEKGEPWKSRNVDGSEGTTYEDLNAIVLNNGKQLDVAYADDELPATGKYGQVTGLFTLSLLNSAYSEGGAFVLGAVGTSAQHVSPDSTGHFACVTKESEGGDYLNLFTEQKDDYRLWYIKGSAYQYDVTLKGYTTGNTTVSTQVWLPVDYAESESDAYLAFDPKKEIGIPDTLDLVGENVTLGENQMQLRLEVNAGAAAGLGGSCYFITPTPVPADRFKYENGATLVPVTLSMTLGPTMKAVNGSELTFWLKDANDEGNNYKFTVRVVIETPASVGYAVKHYGKIYGDVAFDSNDTITSRSAYTAEFISTYSPSAYSDKSWSIIPYWASGIASEYQGYRNEEYSGQNYFEQGTKITMIDLTNANSPQYYYYSCVGNEREISLDSFTKLNGSGLFSATKTGNTVIREKLVFVVDYESTVNDGGRDNRYLMLKHSYNNGANDVLRYTEYNNDGSVSAQRYAPAVQQKVEYEYNLRGTGVDRSALEFKGSSTSSDFLFDTYNFTYDLALRTDVVNTRFADNDFAVAFYMEGAVNLPLGSFFTVEDSAGNVVDVRYMRLGSDWSNRSYIVANIKTAGTYHVTLHVSRYLSFGRFTADSLGLIADLYSTADGSYPNGGSYLQEATRRVQFSIYNGVPNISYNLMLTDITSSGLQVSARLEAFKYGPVRVKDLAPTNGLTVFRELKGDASGVVNVTENVAPSQGNILENKYHPVEESRSLTAEFTLTDTVPTPGTYEYTFLYGTTFETKTVTVS